MGMVLVPAQQRLSCEVLVSGAVHYGPALLASLSSKSQQCMFPLPCA